jgi:putative membrane protein
MMDLITYMPGAMDGSMGGWDIGFWWPFMLVRLLLWGVLLSLLVWFAVRAFSRGRGGTRLGATKDSAEEILRERFARGDISAEEYEKSMRALRETAPQKDYEDSERERDS